MSTKRRHTAKKPIKLVPNEQESLRSLIKKELSPEQIVGYFEKQLYIKFHHETIYPFIYQDKAEGGEL